MKVMIRVRVRVRVRVRTRPLLLALQSCNLLVKPLLLLDEALADAGVSAYQSGFSFGFG